MCLNCGCGQPTNRHGRTGDITIADLKRAAGNDDLSVAQALTNMVETMKGHPEGKTLPGRKTMGTVAEASDLSYVGTSLELKTVNMSTRRITGYAAIHHSMDRVRDIIDPQASVKALQRLGGDPSKVAVFIAHNSDALPIGIPQRIEATPRGLYTDTYILKGHDGDNLLAVAKDLMQHGQPLGMSIGFRTKDSQYEHTAHGRARRILDYQLNEFSYAAHQTVAHPEATVESVKARQRKSLSEGSDTAGGVLVPADRPTKQGGKEARKSMTYRVEHDPQSDKWSVYCDCDRDGDGDDNVLVGTYADEATATAVAVACRHMNPTDYGNEQDQTAKTAPVDGERKAVWSDKLMNDLPDSSFLFVEDGGQKDGDGKTVPRSLRHFPVKDADGKVDLPHVRNAIARISQSDAKGLDDAKKAQLQARARRMLGAADDGKTYVEPEEWKTGSPIAIRGIAYQLLDLSDRVADELKAMTLLGEETKSMQRVRPAVREELRAVEKKLQHLLDWIETVERDQDGKAKLAWYRAQLALTEV